MKKILLAIRINDWWNAIIVPIIAFYFIGLQYSIGPIEISSVLKVFYLLFLSISIASFGFYINELTDIQEDTKAGKKNHVIDILESKRLITLIIILLFCIITSIPFWSNTKIMLLLLVQMILLSVYSCPPIRLKKSPFIAVILDSLYSGTIFFVIALLYSEVVLSSKILIFTIAFGLCRGLRNIIFHIDKDIKIDEKAGQKTIAHITSSERLYQLQGVLFILEIAFLLFILIPISRYTLYIFVLGLIILFVKWSFYKYYTKDKFFNKKKWLGEINTIYEVWLLISVIFGAVYLLELKTIFFCYLGLLILFPSTSRVFHEIYLLGLNFYFVGYKVYYFISDLYFVHTKPHFDIGKWWRNLRGKDEFV